MSGRWSSADRSANAGKWLNAADRAELGYPGSAFRCDDIPDGGVHLVPITWSCNHQPEGSRLFGMIHTGGHDPDLAHDTTALVAQESVVPRTLAAHNLPGFPFTPSGSSRYWPFFQRSTKRNRNAAAASSHGPFAKPRSQISQTRRPHSWAQRTNIWSRIRPALMARAPRVVHHSMAASTGGCARLTTRTPSQCSPATQIGRPAGDGSAAVGRLCACTRSQV
jgi:hypothetical protein